MRTAIDTVEEIAKPVKRRKQTDEERRERGRACSKAWSTANPEKKKASDKARYASNPDKAKARSQAWRDSHRDKYLASARAWKQANPEKIKATRKAHRAKNHERIRARERTWREANKEKQNAHSRAWNKANPEKCKAAIKAWYKAHPEHSRAKHVKRRALKRGALVGDIAEITAWEKKWKLLKRVTCHWCCRKFPPNRCHTDHVMPLSKGGAHSLENLVVACAHCNISKHAKLPEAWNQQIIQPLLL